jgi:hydroxymethylglutaryl-CoA reductase
MNKGQQINGFSKLSKEGKVKWIAQYFHHQPEQAAELLKTFWLEDQELQNVFDGFSENSLSNFLLPYGIAPNFLVNDQWYAVPMVVEESSVVAAASSAAKYWSTRGGFKTTVLGEEKVGHVHFMWYGEPEKLQAVFPAMRKELLEKVGDLTANMEKRGGGITDITLKDFTTQERGYWQLFVTFRTCDSMGANFINSVLEQMAAYLDERLEQADLYQPDTDQEPAIIMSILSNYTPSCLVRAEVSCPVEALGAFEAYDAHALAERFRLAVQMAHLDPHRAATHNKGIFNGIDAVVIATGNDFRAIEAGGHAYAARNGQYASLSHCTVENGIFKFWMDIPLAVGTIGGLTKLHPLARLSLELLGQPSATTLMELIAATGLAQNFAAVRSLVTTGIQRGHMRMHLMNMLNHLEASDLEKSAATEYFQDKVISFNAVRDYLSGLRSNSEVGKTH